jgi:hypothetical protein
LVNKGAHHHSSYCYGGFGYPGRRTHSHTSMSHFSFSLVLFSTYLSYIISNR